VSADKRSSSLRGAKRRSNPESSNCPGLLRRAAPRNGDERVGRPQILSSFRGEAAGLEPGISILVRMEHPLALSWATMRACAQKLISLAASIASRSHGRVPRRFHLWRRANQLQISARPGPMKRGASRSSRALDRGCDGRDVAQRAVSSPTNGTLRTAKSCGPGLPVLRPSARRSTSARRWGQESRSPGRARISRKPPRREGRLFRLVPVVLPRAFLLHADRGCDQHPAFPAPSDLKRVKRSTSLGCSCAARTMRHVRR
jgi:hypothetical protein